MNVKIKYCCECENDSWNKELSFYRFPSNKNISELWMKVLDKTKITTFSRICSSHFVKTDYYEDHQKLRGKRIKKNAVPSRNLRKFRNSFTRDNQVSTFSNVQNIPIKVEVSEKPQKTKNWKELTNCTWEKEDENSNEELIVALDEEKQKIKMKEDRRRRGKKNKLEEIIKNRGYKRGLEIQKIVGATDCIDGGELMFLIKWNLCDELDLLPASEVNLKNPEFVIDFYEARSSIVKAASLRESYSKPLIIKERKVRTKQEVIESIQTNTNEEEEEETQLLVKPSIEILMESSDIAMSEPKQITECDEDFSSNLISYESETSISSFIPEIQDTQGDDISEYQTKLLSDEHMDLSNSNIYNSGNAEDF